MLEATSTLVLGASENPSRYSFLAINRLLQHGYKVLAVGARPGVVNSVPITTAIDLTQRPDTVTLYLSPPNQKPYYDQLLQLKPRRIIFNPGTENQELADLAKAAGIQTTEACTLVLLGTGQY
ncbi:MAG: CoA-binding protein [Chitinophagales bacterium]